MSHSLVVASVAADAHRQSVLVPLIAYNTKYVGQRHDTPPLAIMLRDDATGLDVGGLWGNIGYDWCYVDLLAVPEAARGRGHGRALMQRAELIAREQHCTGIHLRTADFQARGFYEKLGFEVFGTLHDYPKGFAQFFMRKYLLQAAGAN